jgi:hypothetical protein
MTKHNGMHYLKNTVVYVLLTAAVRLIPFQYLREHW